MENFGFKFIETDEMVDLATSYMWKQMVNLAWAYINETRLYEPDEVIEAILKQFKEFEKNFDFAHVYLLVDDFWNWYDFEYARQERIPDILRYFASIIFAIDNTKKQIEEVYLCELYDIYERFTPYIPSRYLA